MGKTALRYLVYPAVMGAAVTALVLLVGGGRSYWVAGPPIIAATAVVAVLLERWLPHAKAWRGPQAELGLDAAHAVANVGSSHVAIFIYGLTAGLWPASIAVWPRHWPFPAQLLLATAILDFSLYAVHVASHRYRWLWKLHAIHHSARRVYWLNGQRRHALHEIVEGLPATLLMGAMGAPPALVGCAIGVLTLHLLFQHGNIDYRAGPLRYVFSVAELHRWHHQRKHEQVQGNYGGLFSIWDSLFGTVLDKKGDAPIDVGLDDEPTLPGDFWGQVRWPLARERAAVATRKSAA